MRPPNGAAPDHTASPTRPTADGPTTRAQPDHAGPTSAGRPGVLPAPARRHPAEPPGAGASRHVTHRLPRAGRLPADRRGGPADAGQGDRPGRQPQSGRFRPARPAGALRRRGVLPGVPDQGGRARRASRQEPPAARTATSRWRWWPPSSSAPATASTGPRPRATRTARRRPPSSSTWPRRPISESVIEELSGWIAERIGFPRSEPDGSSRTTPRSPTAPTQK